MGNKKIELGYTGEEVKMVLGEPKIFDDVYYYFDSELSFHFNNSSCVEFIEFVAGIDSEVRPYIYDVDAFDVLADELYTLLEDKIMEILIIVKLNIYIHLRI